MKFSYGTLKTIVDDLKGRVVNTRINNISVINSHDFLFSFSINRKDKLLISLNHQNPFISLLGVEESLPTIVGKLNDTLRKELKDSLVNNIDYVLGDRILFIEVQRTNDYFEIIKRKLVIELIPRRSNLLVLDENDFIIYALHATSLETNRPTLKGLRYQLPEKADSFFEDDSSSSLEEMRLYAHEYLYLAKNERLKEKYHLLFKHLKSRQKSLKQKIKVLEEGCKTAKENLIYLDHGNALLSLIDDQEEIDNYLNENHLSIDTSLTIGQNANLFFKKYKKAKRTLEMGEIEITKAKEELLYLDTVNAQVEYMNDEELLDLAKELMPHRFQVIKKKNDNNFHVSYVLVDKTKIYFGKNAHQNETITFKLADKKHFYFHIKDYPGSHVVIFSNNPNKEEMLTACEMCLILSNKKSGEVMYCQIESIKKGRSPGQVLINKYQTILLKEVRSQTTELLKNYHRY